MSGECPDEGTCHHGCAEVKNPCFRVMYCGPLSAAHYPDNQWPEEIRAAEITKETNHVTIEHLLVTEGLT